MNIGHLLRQLPAWWKAAEWPAQAFRKYFLTDSDLLAYYFSSDFDPDSDPHEKHDRQDDLLIVTRNFITFYRLDTMGFRQTENGSEGESQTLDKSLIPLEEIRDIHMTWSSIGPFSGHAPRDSDRAVTLTVHLKTELVPFGDVLTLPYRDTDAERDRELTWHQIETFAEALHLALEDYKETSATLNLTDE